MSKQKQNEAGLVPQETIEGKILLIRDKKVMLDRDLACLYGVETRVLNQAVRRNIDRFPEDFMFSLTRQEIRNLSQIVISSKIKHSHRSPDWKAPRTRRRKERKYIQDKA